MRYGSLVLCDLEPPEPDQGQLLVRVRATSVNAVDWYGFSGRPYFARPLMGVRRPRDSAIGSDFAGVIAAVGDGAVIQRRYDLAQIVEAMRNLDDGHARAKIVVTI
jgi:NADPH:quinone reductase-like Zn-dependent oxidoreductase